MSAKLTDREREILSLIVRGHDAKSAARVLHLSPNTIYERLRRAREKIGANNSREAARMFFENETEFDQNFVPEKLVLADAPPLGFLDSVFDDRAPVENPQAHSALHPGVRARLGQFGQFGFLPLRQPGERELRATTADRLRMIGELATKLALTFVAICLSAMIMSNIFQRG